jgi:pimeloyl-ACP methyl ester carboxylesterase
MVLHQHRSMQPEERGDQRLRSHSSTKGMMRSAAGRVFGRPWLDPVASMALRRWFFPVSRLWAAAEIAQGSPEAYFGAVPCQAQPNQRDRVITLLSRFERTRVEAAALDAAWHAAYFPAPGASVDVPSLSERVALEESRREAAHRHNTMRRQFSFLLRADVPRIRHEVPDPADVAAAYDAAFEDAPPFFAPPEATTVEQSRSVPTAEGRDFWIRFASPSLRLADQVYARVYEPAGLQNPPTLIFGHGICVEYDQWSGLIDEAAYLCGLGIRVIRPEAAWHGRRRPRGFYGGERMIATFPSGSLDLFTGAVREWAVMADWARRTSSGPLAFGGSSLGALTAQLAASRAKDWPEALRPDALLLITHCEQLSQVAMEGDLTRMWGGREAFEAKGWSADRITHYLRLLDPGAELAVRPEKIVTVLGKRDGVTPFASGAGLVDKWGVPEENRFIWDRGHFSVPATLLHDQAPLRRFREILS